jgi:hypothetical protein
VKFFTKRGHDEGRGASFYLVSSGVASKSPISLDSGLTPVDEEVQATMLTSRFGTTTTFFGLAPFKIA